MCDMHRADTERDAFIAGVQEGAKAAEARIVAWLESYRCEPASEFTGYLVWDRDAILAALKKGERREGK